MDRSILIVEDEPVLARWLEQTAVRRRPVRVVHSLREAKTLVAPTTTAPWWCVILDVGLPDGNGLELLGDLQTNHHSPPTLVLTGLLEPESINAIQMYGAQYAVKPVSSKGIDAFLDRVERTSGEIRKQVLAAVDRLSKQNGLTPSEQKIVAISVEGVSRGEMADTIGVSSNTLKTQVRSILSKVRGASDLGDITRSLWAEVLKKDRARSE